MAKRRTHPAAPTFFPPLSPAQEQAITLLLEGKTTTEVPAHAPLNRRCTAAFIGVT